MSVVSDFLRNGLSYKAVKASIKFLNWSGKNFDLDNNELSKLEVTEDQSKMIHPTIPAEIPGIELESDLATPSRVQVRSDKPDMADRSSAAGVSAGIDDNAATNKETR